MMRCMKKTKKQMVADTAPWLAGTALSVPPGALGWMARGVEQAEYSDLIAQMQRTMPDLPVRQVMEFAKYEMVHLGAAPLTSLVLVESALRAVANYMPNEEYAAHLEDHAAYYAAAITWCIGIAVEVGQAVFKKGEPEMLDVACNTVGLLMACVLPRLIKAWPDIRDGKDVIALMQPIQRWVMQEKERALEQALVESMTGSRLSPMGETERLLVELAEVDAYHDRHPKKKPRKRQEEDVEHELPALARETHFTPPGLRRF